MDWFMGKGRKKDKEAPPLNQENEYKQYLEDNFVRDKILDTDLSPLVRLPDGLDSKEWIATHTIAFFDHINLLFGVVSEFCTNTVCPTMTAPGNTQYVWSMDKSRERKNKCSAANYIDYVLTFSGKTLQDPAVFPTKFGVPFPDTYMSECRKIYRYVFHVIAHMYHAHFKQLINLGLHKHLNLVFHHFIKFAHHYKLIDDKETEILDDLYNKLEGTTTPCSPYSDITTTPDNTDGLQQDLLHSIESTDQTTPGDNTDPPSSTDRVMCVTPLPSMECTPLPNTPTHTDSTPQQPRTPQHNMAEENKENCGYTLPPSTPSDINPYNCVLDGDGMCPSSGQISSAPPISELERSGTQHQHHHSNGSATGVQVSS